LDKGYDNKMKNILEIQMNFTKNKQLEKLKN